MLKIATVLMVLIMLSIGGCATVGAYHAPITMIEPGKFSIAHVFNAGEGDQETITNALMRRFEKGNYCPTGFEITATETSPMNTAIMLFTDSHNLFLIVECD